MDLAAVLAWLSSLFSWVLSVLTGSILRRKPLSQPTPRLTTRSVQPIPPEDGLPAVLPLEHTSASFAAAVSTRLGRGGVLAKAMYREYFAAASLGQEFDLPAEVAASSAALASKVVGLTSLGEGLPLAFVGEAVPPEPGCTDKYVLRCAAGGEEVEMVAMPAPGGESSTGGGSGGGAAWSLCISSQVGCRMGCKFCETGKMGLLRNLSVAEIVCQVALASKALGLRVANVVLCVPPPIQPGPRITLVYTRVLTLVHSATPSHPLLAPSPPRLGSMGMGEPLDNVDAVIGAIRVLTDPLGLNLSMSHVTVSTSGVAQHVYTLLDALPSVRLAFSLHAANDELRTRLMPINSKVGLRELSAAMATYLRATKRRVTIQYVLLHGVNDSLAHAAELATFLATVGPPARLHVNLIPYNAQSGPAAFAAPSHEACKEFKTALQHAGLFTKIRVEKGAEKMAACGQVSVARISDA